MIHASNTDWNWNLYPYQHHRQHLVSMPTAQTVPNIYVYKTDCTIINVYTTDSSQYPCLQHRQYLVSRLLLCLVSTSSTQILQVSMSTIPIVPSIHVYSTQTAPSSHVYSTQTVLSIHVYNTQTVPIIHVFSTHTLYLVSMPTTHRLYLVSMSTAHRLYLQ
jgi:hypothetical protein